MSSTTDNLVVSEACPVVRFVPIQTEVIPAVNIDNESSVTRPVGAPRELLVHAKGGRKAASREQSTLLAAVSELTSLYKESTNKECDSVNHACGANTDIIRSVQLLITNFKQVRERMSGERKVFPVSEPLLEFLRNADFGMVITKSQRGKAVDYTQTSERLIDRLPMLMSGYSNMEALAGLARIYLHIHPETHLSSKGKGPNQYCMNAEMRQYLADVISYKIQQSEKARQKAIVANNANIPQVFTPDRIVSNTAKSLFTYYLGTPRDHDELIYMTSREVEDQVRAEMNLINEQVDYIKRQKAAGVSSSNSTEED